MSKLAVTLKPNEEWYFEVKDQQKVTFVLTEGRAEINGTEIAIGKEYEFQKTLAAVFTFHGCRLEWEGECTSSIESNRSMLNVANVHFALENLRQKASVSGQEGPITLLLGPENSGKTTLSKTLVSYAARMSRVPILANLDTESPVFSPPGSLTATPVSHVLDVEEFYGLPPINGPSVTRNKQSLVYTYGLLNFQEGASFYRHQVRLLAAGIRSRLKEDPKVRSSGVLIDTPSRILDDTVLLQDVISEFGCSSIVTIGAAENRESLDLLARDTNVEIIHLDGVGAKPLDAVFRRQIQRQVIQDYFFGNSRRNLSPFTITANLKDVVVYRPLAEKELESELSMLTKVPPSAVLQNSLLAVVNAEPTESVDIIQSAETLGYVHVVEADEEKSLIKILLPAPGKLPKHALVMGDVKYHE